MTLRDLIRSGRVTGEEFSRAADVATPMDGSDVTALLGDEDADVRAAALLALPHIVDDPEPALVGTVIAMTQDPHPRVRDHACFVLGCQWTQLDTPALRAALVARLEDDDDDARCEALAGLARRQDPRAFPYVRAALSGPTPRRLELEAAGLLGDPRLHALVLDHLEGWDDDDEPFALAQAVRRLTDPAGPGDDLLAGVAALYRARASGTDETAWLGWWRLMATMLDLAPRRAEDYLAAVDAVLDDDPGARALLRDASALATMAETEHD